jgi:hypothetical protein
MAVTHLLTPARIAAALLVLATGTARAEDPPKVDLTVTPPAEPAKAPAADYVTAEVPAPPTNRGIAWLEVVGVNLTLNLGGRILKPEETSYDFTLETWKANLTGGWEYDGNKFVTNQYAHPYEGSLFYNSCRSNGLGFYESFACTFVGSYIWEVFMEIHPPSINDQITTTVGGAFLGEALYRLSSRILDNGDEPLDFWRQFSAAAVSPMNGLNRVFYGDKYRDRRLKPYPISGELAVAFGVAGRDDSLGEVKDLDKGALRFIARATHGLPTEDGWRFRRPFDHFDIATSLSIDRNSFTDRSGINLLIRGLVLGDDYGSGHSSGLWGLWGAYDVLSVGELRSSTSAVTFGTVGQWAPSPSLRLQGTAYLGAGFGAAGSNVEIEDKRDYHFGAQGLALVDLRLLWGNRFRAKFSAREYVTGDQLSPDQGGYEDITYSAAELLFRVWDRHALGVEALGIRRQASYEGVPDVNQRLFQVSVMYTFVTEPSMGTGGAMYW